LRRLQPVGRKVLAALLVFFSGCVVWSEATIFTGGHPDLSPFSRAIRWAGGRVGVKHVHRRCLQQRSSTLHAWWMI
jgi:uncharacterized membrane protein YdcZ (DUF606 family)